MAYINLYSIVDAVYSAKGKTVSIFGEMDMTGEIYALIAEGELEDFCDRQEQVYTFDLTDRAEFNYCIRWVNKNLEEDQRSLPFGEKLKLLKGKIHPEVLVDNRTVRDSYAQYWKQQELKKSRETENKNENQKKGKSRK